VPWNRSTGLPLAHALSWQDTRAAHELREMGAFRGEIREKTGLFPSPHYGASKIRWLLQNSRPVQEAQDSGQLVIGPLSSFLCFHLIHGAPLVVDHANAARTLLWNMRTQDWDKWLLDLFEIPRSVLPDVVPIRSSFGALKTEHLLLKSGEEKREMPVYAVSGDQNAAYIGVGGSENNRLVVNIGSGAFCMARIADVGSVSESLLVSLVDSGAHSDIQYVIEGTVNGAGTALLWLGEQMGTQLEEVQWKQIEDPAIFLNCVGGLGSPWWRTGIRSSWEQTAAPVSPEEQKAAVMESILFLLYKNFEVMRESLVSSDSSAAWSEPSEIIVAGGLSQDEELCQRMANLFGISVVRPKESEATARGIAWLASRQSLHFPASWRDVFLPNLGTNISGRYKKFLKALHELC
ncbi:MAG: hypothetical protein KDD60_09145, partial [Bdellovibrionales bacterium]|nr:hypothetical protein [Bdellovibrionales bacterium]